MEIKVKCVDNGYVFDYDDINGYGDKVNKTEVHADTIVVDSVVYDYDDWVQMQWSVDSGYDKTN